jgi:hypothetical protein
MSIRKGRTLRSVLNFLQGNRADGKVTRQPNTAGLRSKLSKMQQGHLYQLSEQPGYQVLLDVIEMACVEQDTKLINADPAQPETVLSEHRMSKAFWQIFVAIQKKVEYEREEFLAIRMKENAPEAVPDEETDQEILGL